MTIFEGNQKTDVDVEVPGEFGAGQGGRYSDMTQLFADCDELVQLIFR